MSQLKISAIFTCFNRKEKSVACVKSLIEGNPSIDFNFVVVDDNSTDGTTDALLAISAANVEIIHGNGKLYWCGGMRVGIDAFLNSKHDSIDYCLLVNDDVEFYPKAIENMVRRIDGRENYVVVGATCNDNGEFTYGLKCREKWYKRNVTKRVYPHEKEIKGETFNANAVLIPTRIIEKFGNMDSIYTHSLGDYDYGFRLSDNGISLISTSSYVGVCNGNSSKGSWNDKTLSRRERLKKKESPKGCPRREWWHFLCHNYGLLSAIKYSTIPYIRILIKR